MAHRLLLLTVALFALTASASAADNKFEVKGIYLLADYPALSVEPGSTSTVNLKLRNYGLAPERLTLSVRGVRKGWVGTLLGGGRPVAVALAGPAGRVPTDTSVVVSN